jgi:glucose-1-phosphate thymidylyltransferase
MKVIIPIAGFGSRLRPHTFTVPKSLLPVGGKPIVAHIVDQVVAWGGTKFTFIVGHLRERLQDYLQAEYRLDFEFRHQEKLLGLGHAVLTGLDPDDHEVLVILGDTILDTDLGPVLRKGVTSIGVKPVEDARKFGVVELSGTNVKRLIEKSPNPPTNLAIVGIYYIRDGAMLGRAIKEVIEQGLTVKGEYQLTDALQMMLDWGEKIETFPVEGWYDCGKPETLLETNRFILDKHGGQIAPDSLFESQVIYPVAIAEGARIERSVIGPYVSIGPKSLIKESIISNTICGDDAIIEYAVVTDSLIGSRCRLRGKQKKVNIGASSEIEL